MAAKGAFPLGSRVGAVLVGLGLLLAAVQAWQERALRAKDPAVLEAQRGVRLGAAQERFSALAGSVRAAADRAAALAGAREALRGDRAALVEVFRSLERLGAQDEGTAAAIHALPLAKLAWARPTVDLRGLEGPLGTKRGLHVFEGSVTTTLIATAPIEQGGRVLGLATAETALRVERHIANEFLRDFDRIADRDPGIRVEYFGVQKADAPPAPADTLVLRAPEGRVLAFVTADSAAAGSPEAGASQLPRRAGALLVWLGLLALALGPHHGLLGLTALAAALRLSIPVLGLPWPLPPALADPSGTAALETFLNALLFLLVTAALCRLVLTRAPASSNLVLSAVAGLLSLPLLGLAFALVAALVAGSPWDLTTVSLVPRSAAHLALQTSLLLVLAAALCVLVAVLALGGPIPRLPKGRLQRSLVYAVIGGTASLFWPKDVVGLPLAPAVLLFLAAALLAGTHATWRAKWAEASAGARAVALLAVTAGLAVVLHPTLVHFGEKAQRRRIEGDHAERVRTQAAWRAARLRDVRRAIDSLQVLEESAGRAAPGLEELAFSIWADTGLSGTGIASAVEVQDRTGAFISRFAWDLPALLASAAPPALPKEDAWSVTRVRLEVGSAARNVLHARRRLSYDGVVHGAVHVFLGDDPWDLPFLPRRDPYTTLFRSAPSPDREEGLDLTVFARPDGVAFTSTERPPALTPELRQRLRETPGGFWTTLPVDGRRHHTYLLPLGDVVYALSYPRLAAGAFLAGLAEAVAGFSAVAVIVVLAVTLARTLAGKRTLTVPSLVAAVRGRFALRLFVAFAAAAVLPVAALELAFRGWVADRLRRESEEQALERAAVAQRAVDDFSFYQATEGPDRAAVTDSALVWVSRLIRGDVDVFGQGRLLASSKRELFSSGLLPGTAPGPVFRALTLEGASSVLRAESIGGFSALVAYVPVRLRGVEPDILALPLAVKEREARTTLEEFDRSMRLASLAFLALAAGLALSLSRRISEPIRDLTRATRRVAGGDLEARVSTPSRDELRDLVDSFNQMAGDLERQRRELERSNRLAAWADMARQVAHEVKNPLTPIQLSVEHLLRVWRDRAPDFESTLETCTDTILRQVRTLRGMVTEFSAFARPPAPEPEAMDAAQLVREALRPYGSSLPPRVSLDVHAEPELPSLRLDRRLVTRAIVNLVENGLHAVGDAGRISVRIQRSADGKAVEISVEDDGPGLSAEALARAFEPFFSTKAAGSGLGLALVKRVAEDHGGSATLQSVAGEFTRATLRFPCAGDEPARPVEAVAGLAAGDKP